MMHGLPRSHGGGTGHGHGRGGPSTIWVEARPGTQRAAIKRSERIGIPVEWVLLWDVSPGLPCTVSAPLATSSELSPSKGGLAGLRALLSAFLQISPFVHSHLEQAVVGANHSLLEALAVPPCSPSHRKRYWRGHRCSVTQTRSDILGLFLTR